jgi:microcystin-dependent protein
MGKRKIKNSQVYGFDDNAYTLYNSETSAFSAAQTIASTASSGILLTTLRYKSGSGSTYGDYRGRHLKVYRNGIVLTQGVDYYELPLSSLETTGASAVKFADWAVSGAPTIRFETLSPISDDASVAYASVAGIAYSALTVSDATNVAHATSATSASYSVSAVYASLSGSASYATVALSAINQPVITYVTSAGSAGFAENSGKLNSLTYNEILALVTAAATAVTSAPVGSVMSYAGATPPSGWFLCNGASVSKTTYASLFAVISNTYGTSTDPATLFKLPDLRGYFVRGLDGGAGVDVGRVLGTSQVDENKAHGHTVSNLTAGGATYYIQSPIIPANTTYASATLTNTSVTGTESRPKNVAMNYIIKF